jgi:antitoxin (DNA-binding transcriptional repressor) of toxin-antitoxin stability system
MGTGVAKLKAELSKYLRLAKLGKETVVLEHDKPIARLIPYREASPLHVLQLSSRKPAHGFALIAKEKFPEVKGSRAVVSLQSDRNDR